MHHSAELKKLYPYYLASGPCPLPQTWGQWDNLPTRDGASAATGNHGNIPVSAHHDGYTKDVCVYIVCINIMLQPLKSTPAPGLIADPQQCM